VVLQIDMETLCCRFVRRPRHSSVHMPDEKGSTLRAPIPTIPRVVDDGAKDMYNVVCITRVGAEGRGGAWHGKHKKRGTGLYGGRRGATVFMTGGSTAVDSRKSRVCPATALCEASGQTAFSFCPRLGTAGGLFAQRSISSPRLHLSSRSPA